MKNKHFKVSQESCVTTLHSERIYDLERMQASELDKSIRVFSQMRFSAYNESLKDHRRKLEQKKTGKKAVSAKTSSEKEESLFKNLREKYAASTYYTNSAIQIGAGAFNSQKSCNDNYISGRKETLKAVSKKQEKISNRIEKRKNDLLKAEAHFKAMQADPTGNQKTKFECFNGTMIIGWFVTVGTKRKKKPPTMMKLQDFIYQKLKPEIRRLKSINGRLKYRINNLENKIANAENLKCIRFCHDDKTRKNSILKLSGRSDSPNKNFTVIVTPIVKGAEKHRWVNEKRSKEFLANQEFFNVRLKLMNGSDITFDVCFPHNGKLLKQALQSGDRFPIEFGIEKHWDPNRQKDYYIFTACLDKRNVIKPKSHLEAGCIGIDLNVGHIDWAETRDTGVLMDYGSIPYRVDGTKEENAQSLHSALKQVAKMAGKKGKPIAIEDLDTKTSKWKSTYRNRALNRTYHLFPYERYTRMITVLALEYETEVFRVKPAMTSIIGTLKYARTKSIPNHIAAALVIARRAQGFMERIPRKWKSLVHTEKNNWAQWNELNRQNRKLVSKKFKHPSAERYKANVLLPFPKKTKETAGNTDDSLTVLY